MERFKIEALKEWKISPQRKPLILYGARQVGKTWLLKEFGRTCYKKVAYFSFYNNPRLCSVFEGGLNIDRIVTSLSIEADLEITAEDTLIIFDEIQNCLNVLHALKYVNEDANQYHIIAAGSLLGVALHEGVSYPVGKVDTMTLYPMNFCEFLCAIGKNRMSQLIRSGDLLTASVFSDELIFHLKNYMYVGGMPEAVKYFAEHKNYKDIRNIQNEIIHQYAGDFGKHIPSKDIPRVHMVWNGIPMQLAKENKKFFFGKIKKGARSSEFETAIQWLTDAGLIYKVNKVSAPHLPLKAYIDLAAYKLFMLDVGLLGALSDLDAKEILEDNAIFSEFKGALAEQFVLEELLSNTDFTPYYYASDNATYEQDFLIQKDGAVIPVEVKASSNIHSPSLKAYTEKFAPEYAVRFSTLNYKRQDKIVNIPLYAVGAINSV